MTKRQPFIDASVKANRFLYDELVKNLPTPEEFAGRTTSDTAPYDLQLDVACQLHVAGLMVLARAMDVRFHRCMENVFAPHLEPYADLPRDHPYRGLLGYYRGPVKGPARMSEKVLEYAKQGEPYPQAACIIDPIRATVCFETPVEILAALTALQTQAEWKLVRVKNRYNAGVNCGFRNLMVNVMVEAQGAQIVGEVQLTTAESLKLKKLQHKYYEIQRAYGDEPGGKVRSAADAFEAILKDVCGVHAH